MLTIMCIAVADYIIQKTNEYNNNVENKVKMTCKRLMKLIFFCDIEYMKKNSGLSLISDEYVAWESGPVLPEVYLKYMKFQTGTMFPIGDEFTNLPESICKIIDMVVEHTIKMSTHFLINVTHVEDGPWYKYKEKKTIIPKKEIYKYYKKNKGIIEYNE